MSNTKLIQQREKTRMKLGTQLAELPMLPMLLARLSMMNPASDEFANKVEKLAYSDPTFATRLMRLANGDSLKNGSSALTVPRAIARVGAVSLADLVTVNNVMRAFIPMTHGQRALWLHSIQVAEIARCIAGNSHHLSVDPGTAYVAGLLHDMGRFVMFDESPEELGAIDESGWQSPDDLIRAEEAICGYDHAALGGLAFDAWGLPAELTALVRDHHKLGTREKHGWSIEEEQLIVVVQMADAASFVSIDTDFIRGAHTKKMAIIEQRCVHSSWKRPPVSTDFLAQRLIHLRDKAFAEAAQIGIIQSLPK